MSLYTEMQRMERNIMKKHWLSLAIASFGLTLMFNPVAASADPEVFEASGATPADIQTAVDAFRNFLGDNNGVAAHFPLAAVRSTGTGFQTLSPHRACCRRISSTATRRAA